MQDAVRRPGHHWMRIVFAFLATITLSATLGFFSHARKMSPLAWPSCQ